MQQRPSPCIKKQVLAGCTVYCLISPFVQGGSKGRETHGIPCRLSLPLNLETALSHGETGQPEKQVDFHRPMPYPDLNANELILRRQILDLRRQACLTHQRFSRSSDPGHGCVA